MNPILIFFITVAVSTVFWTSFYSIIFCLLYSEWKGCLKCDCPVKTTKAEKICKNCKKEGFRFKTKKRIWFEAWEKKVNFNKIDKIYNNKSNIKKIRKKKLNSRGKSTNRKNKILIAKSGNGKGYNPKKYEFK